MPGRDAVTNRRWGVAPSLALGPGNAHARDARLLAPGPGQPARLRAALGARRTNPPLAAFSGARPPVDSRTSTASTRATTRTDTDLATAQRRARPGHVRCTLREQLRYGRTRRDSVITAPRFVYAVNHAAPDLNRQLQSRDMTDTIAVEPAEPDRPLRDRAASAHALASASSWRGRRSVNFLRTRPDRAGRGPLRARPGRSLRRADHAHGRLNDGTADSLAAFRVRHRQAGAEKLEVTGGLRWDRFDVEYDATAATRRGDPLRARRRHAELAGRRVFKPRRNASVYAGYGNVVQPLGRGAVARPPTTAALAPEKTRSYELGTKWDVAAAGSRSTAALFRTEKTNARTPGVNPGDPPPCWTAGSAWTASSSA